MPLSSRDAAGTMIRSRPSETPAGQFVANPRDLELYNKRKDAERAARLEEAGITPEMERSLEGDMRAAGSRSMWNYGPGFQRYRARAAMDALAAGHGFDPEAWSLPAGYTLRDRRQM